MLRIINHLLIGIGLIVLSALIYFLQIFLFHDAKNTEFYLFQDLAFIPIQVLLLTVLLNKYLNLRQKREMLKKMNMVIGAFFSSMGTELLSILSGFHEEKNNLRSKLNITMEWNDETFKSICKLVSTYDFIMNHNYNELVGLKKFIKDKNDFLLSLLENANLLEHDSFTDMLWAVFHVSDELASREDLSNLPQNDYKHLEGDLMRAYSNLLHEWLLYMKHLKNDYPYLYSLATRKNPFISDAKVIFE